MARDVNNVEAPRFAPHPKVPPFVVASVDRRKTLKPFPPFKCSTPFGQAGNALTPLRSNSGDESREAFCSLRRAPRHVDLSAPVLVFQLKRTTASSLPHHVDDPLAVFVFEIRGLVLTPNITRAHGYSGVRIRRERHHRNVNDQSQDELAADLDYIDQRCKEYGIPAPQTFCYPGYSNGPGAVEVLMEKGFCFARRGVAPEFSYDSEGGRGPAYDPTHHNPLLIPTTGASGPNWKFDDFVWGVEQARDGKITVLTFHGVPDLDHPWVDTSPQMFEACMRYLNENGYTVIPLGGLEKYISPARDRI